MDFISNQNPQIEEMLKIIGVEKIDDLFSSIPSDLIIKKRTEDDGLSEYEGLRLMETLASLNTFPSFENYLGGGSYEHHTPAIVNAICSKSEFLTSYTPYQPEASQGMLQIIFEFQSALCALTGMDVANASVYDGAAACAEAVLMALRVNPSRNKILIAESLHPHYRGVIEQYLAGHSFKIETVSFNSKFQIDTIEKKLDENTAAFLIQSPNFFGVLENSKELFAQAKKVGALSLLCGNPLSYGIYAAPKEVGADIAIGDCQPFGIPLQFGGPYAGYMACSQDLVRQLPGRIVGETLDTKGRRGFVLTLQAREQHIRREKATSNICTNQALSALACLIALLWYGKKGVPALAWTNFQRASFLRAQLAQLKKVEVNLEIPIFNEFTVKFKNPLTEVQKHFRAAGIEPGIDLGRFYPHLENQLLVAVTETKNEEQLKRFVKIASEL